MTGTSTFTLEVQELRRPSVVHSLTVKWSNTVGDIKQMVQSLANYPSSRMRILRNPNSPPLSDGKTLGELGIDQVGHTLIVSLQFSANPQYVIEPVASIPLDADSKEMVYLVQQGLNAKQVPAKTDLLDCTGGVYFMKSQQGGLVAVFKPQDEEQGMPRNPKGHREGLREGVLPGEGYLREVAAYLLDQGHFCQVPPTAVVHCEHPAFHYSSLGVFPKLGSLQRYVRASDTFEDISPSLVGTLELQKIALLDMRLLNCDRNASNILAIRKPLPGTFNNGVRPRRGSRSGSDLSSDETAEVEMEAFLNEAGGSGNGNGSNHGNDLYELIPIDHGYCCPTRLLIEDFDWAWFNCPQIARPVDPAIRDYLLSLDVDAQLAALAERVTLPAEALFLLRLVHRVLAEGVARGLTLRDIAGLIARTEDGKPSPLEKVVATAEENALRSLEVQAAAVFSAARSPPAAARQPADREGGREGNRDRDRRSPPLGAEDGRPTLRRVVRSELFLQAPSPPRGRVEEGAGAGEGSPLGYFVNDLDEPAPSPRPLRPLAGAPLARLRTFDQAPRSADARAQSYRATGWLPGAAERAGDLGDLTSSEASCSDLGSSPRGSCPALALPLARSRSPADDKERRRDCGRDGGRRPRWAALRRRRRSDTTTDDEASEGSTSSGESDCAPLPLARVASFGALQSPPLYDVEARAPRQVHLLKRARGRELAKSAGFFARRLEFAASAVDQLLQREVAALAAK